MEDNTKNLKFKNDNSENNEAINKLHKTLKIPFVICMFLYIASLFTVFFTPIDILDTNKNCADFVNFMEQIFSNIKIFGSVSKIPQVIKFHASVVWVFATILCLLSLIYVFYSCKINSNAIKSFPIFSIILPGLFLSSGIWIYSSGYIVKHTFDYGIRVIKITMSGKFEIFFYIGIFQSAFIVSFFVAMSVLSVLFFKIKTNFKENKK
ncbi:MAG: hypothetical protein J6W17_00850 [Campylobacter sp.]|nr:hypothetical protein [Campylobacter sp.]